MEGMYKSEALISNLGWTGSSWLYLMDQSEWVKGNNKIPNIKNKKKKYPTLILIGFIYR